MIKKEEIHVLILGGFPRAGTRQFADILNNHIDINIKGECFPLLFEKMAEFFEESDRLHNGRWSESQYLQWKIHSVLNAYAGISKGSNTPYNFHEGKIYGFKCPRIEIKYDSIKKLFNGLSTNIIYIYCTRNIKQNYLSENSAFNITIEKYINRTIQSLSSILSVVNDNQFDVEICSLDDFILSLDKGCWLNYNLFSKLPVDKIKDTTCYEFYLNTTNRNATEFSGKTRRKELSEEEYRFFVNHKKLNNVVSEFEKITQTNIWTF